MHPKLRALQTQLQPAPLVHINCPELQHYGVELWLKREDLIHPIISGNKWRKLKYILQDALDNDADSLISMGGAWSNHLHALAYTGAILGLQTAAFIRGERPPQLSPSLQDMLTWGMRLDFVSRQDFQQLRQYKDWNSLPNHSNTAYWIPEGGSSALALAGVGELVEEIALAYDYLVVPCGTGTTLAGLLQRAPAQATVLGFAALKNSGFLEAEVCALLNGTIPAAPWQINSSYHFGGFAKTSLELHQFMSKFEALTAIALEPIYTSKMLFGVYELVRQGYFKRGERIIAIHTGGLQGRRTLHGS